MSKDNAEGGNGQQREITAVAGNDNAKDEDIQDFAEHTVNELLAWYGYGDRENDQLRRRHHHHHRRRHHDDAHSRCHDDDDDDNVCVRHRDSTSDVTDLVPDLLVRPNSGCEILKRAHQRREVNADNEFMDSSHSPPPPTTTTHVANLKSQSFETEYLLEQRPEVSPPTTTTTNTTTITTTTTTTTTSMSRKLCDWCQQKPPNVDFSDSVDGLNPLSFCSERCLNRYKMNLFCTETRQYLQQIHSSEDSSCDVTSAIASDNSRILITPDLWMSDEKQQGGSDVTPPAEVTASIVVYDDDDDDDDDNLRHSGASERHDDVRHRRRRGVTSSNVSVTHFGEWKRNKRRKEEEEEERTKVGEGGEGGEGGNRMTSSPGDRVAMVTGDDDDVFDSECESVGRGRRLQRDSIPGHSNRLGKTFGVNPEVISTPSSSSTTSSSSYSAVEGSITFASDGGAIGLGCCGGGGGGDKIKDRFESLRRAEFRHPQSSTSNLHNDHTVFRRLGGEGQNLGETSRGENPFGSWQDKSAVPPFNSTTFFAPGASLPGNPLFSVPTMPSVMHLLGPTLNPQFLGCGSSNPLPVFGIPPPNPIPGAEGGVGGAGPHIAAGVPVAPLQAPANPWSCLLPPGTLMVPYPFLLPLPIPIPIPFPLPVKSEESTECVVVGSGERKTRKSEEAVSESTVGDLRSSAESLKKHIQNLPKVVVDRFPAPKIVCSCCRKDSSSCVSESWATAAAAAAQPRDPPHPKTFFCTASLPADFEPLRSSDPIGDASGALLSSQTPNDDDDDDDDDDYDDDNNHILDFSMSRNQKSTPNRSSSFLRTPPHVGVGGSTAPLPSPTVSVKSEPLDLAAYSSAAENSFRPPPPQPPPLPSSSSPGFKRTAVGPAAVASGSLHSFPALPYLARRSLILDAPSILGERPQHVKKNMVETSSTSKRFAYCKRRHSNVHVKTK